MKHGGQGVENRKRLLRRDDDGAVVRLRARLDVQHGIRQDMLVQYADFVDAAHNATHLRDRCPGKFVVRIE